MQVNMHEAKSQLSKLGEAAVAGEDVIIAKNGKPYLRLTPYKVQRKPRKAGLNKGEGWIAEDYFESDQVIISLFEGDEP